MWYKQVISLPEDYLRVKIEEFLLEDMPSLDVTSCGVFEGSEVSAAIIQAEEDLVFAGRRVIEVMFEEAEAEVKFGDSDFVRSGEAIAIIRGGTDYILRRERVLLNLLQRMCGIATMTKKYVDIAKRFGVEVLDTRKTTPGLRLFEKYAVVAGGGNNHRMDLSSGILIKDNHIKAAGGVKEAVERVRSRNSFGLKIEVEVENIEQVRDAMAAGADGLLLDNFGAAELKNLVRFIREGDGGKDIFIEASGGINPDNLGDYVITGVNAISSGALTHSVKSAEIHLEFVD
jgi:nicotinate-nucleotide pyrophosphorylase (carboxylating)